MTEDAFNGDLEPVAEEQVDAVETEDHEYDNFDDAVDALSDDDQEDQPEDEQPDEPEDAAEEEAEAEGEEDSEADDAVIELPNGDTLTVSELEEIRANGLRQSDYTQKTTELAERRKQIDEIEGRYSERLGFAENVLQNLSTYLETLVPEEPPLALAQTDPGAYQYQRALREQAVAEIGKLVNVKKDLDDHKSQSAQQDMQKYREAEEAKLAEALPHLKDPARKAAFDKNIAEAAKEFGFSDDEISQTADHRILQLVHFAKIGKRAEQNRNNAKRRVETPRQGKKPKAATTSPKAAQNRQAMQRLSKSGSVEDALRIDFD